MGRRLLATWLCLLRAWAERNRPAVPGNTDDSEGRLAFMVRNKARQEELHRVFAPYYRFCPACGSVCCREPEVPFSDLDRLLGGVSYTGQASPGADAGLGDRGLFSCLQRSFLDRKLKRFTRGHRPPESQAKEPAASFCPALTDVGCSLPWGKRPAVCVFCACPQILAEMDWPTYGRYLRGTIKYLAHLSLELGWSASNRS